MSTPTTLTGDGRNWEGLGGPIRVDRANLDGIDPTLDACCQREEENARIGNALKRTLQRYDVVAEKERRRRHLVQTSDFDGCRCCYDPNSDGGEYRALLELRQLRRGDGQVQESGLELCETLNETENEESDSENADTDDEFDYLLDEDLPGQNEELKAMEESRRSEIEMEMLFAEVASQHGFGVHRQMHPSRVLKAAGLATSRDPAPAVVLHLVDADSLESASLDLHLEHLAQTYKGTKFMRSGGRSTLLMDAQLAAKGLPPLRPDKDMPALVVVRNGVAVNVCPSLQGLVERSGTINPSAVTCWLDYSGVLLTQRPNLEDVCRIRPEEEALMDYLTTLKPEREEPRFDCGNPLCNKSFAHEHIGEKNEVQDGVVVSEEVVTGEIKE